MVLPERNHAAKQLRAPEYGTIRNSRSTDDDMASASGRVLVSVEVEFFGYQPVAAGFFVDQRQNLFELIPVFGGRQVDLKDAGVGRDAE